ncbi:MAG: hypothetical protein ACKOOI_21220 [Pirellula sp.]
MHIEQLGSLHDPVGVLENQVAVDPRDLGKPLRNERGDQIVDESFFLPKYA